MSWTIDNEKYSEIIKGASHLDICSTNGALLKIQVDSPIAHAGWKGDDLLVKLQDGETRQYLNTRHYLILPELRKRKVSGFLKPLFAKFSDSLHQNIHQPSGDYKLHPRAGISR